MNQLLLRFGSLVLASVSMASFAGGQTFRSTDHAPELVGATWLNTPRGEAATLKSREGKVTLVAFWTFACENCQNNLLPYRRLLDKYRKKGVELISIHTPELGIERDFDEVRKHVAKYKIDYPVLIDNKSENWNRWHVSMWPSLYVVDKKGIIQYHWFGELNYHDAGGEAQIAKVLDHLLKTD